jgi:hypothetical protein
MTSKEKAEDLFRDFYEMISGIPKDKVIFYMKEDYHVKCAIECAIICVDELFYQSTLYDKTVFEHAKSGFWAEVKHELLNL